MKNILNCFILILLYLYIISSALYAQSDLKLVIEESLAVSAGENLNVNTQSGSVVIKSWDKSTAEIKIYAEENILDKFTFKIFKTEISVKVEGRSKSDNSNLNKPQIRFEIFTPKNFNINVFTGNGKIDISNITGTIEANTSGGTINITDVTGNLNLFTSGGHIVVEKNTGDINASTSGGNISITEFTGNIKVSTSGGNISLSGQNGKIDAATSGGNITLDYNGPNKGIELSTLGGNISVTIPVDFEAETDISTKAGKINSDFGKPESRNSSAHLKTNINNGNVLLKASTSAGNISLLKQ